MRGRIGRCQYNLFIVCLISSFVSYGIDTEKNILPLPYQFVKYTSCIQVCPLECYNRFTFTVRYIIRHIMPCTLSYYLILPLIGGFHKSFSCFQRDNIIVRQQVQRGCCSLTFIGIVMEMDKNRKDFYCQCCLYRRKEVSPSSP